MPGMNNLTAITYYNRIVEAENALLAGHYHDACKIISEIPQSPLTILPVDDAILAYHLAYLHATLSCILNSNVKLAKHNATKKNNTLLLYKNHPDARGKIADAYRHLAHLMINLNSHEAAIHLFKAAGDLLSEKPYLAHMGIITSLSRDLMALSKPELALNYLLRYIEAFNNDAKIYHAITLINTYIVNCYNAAYEPLKVNKVYTAIKAALLIGNYYVYQNRIDIARRHYTEAVWRIDHINECPDLNPPHKEFTEIKTLLINATSLLKQYYYGSETSSPTNTSLICSTPVPPIDNSTTVTGVRPSPPPLLAISGLNPVAGKKRGRAAISVSSDDPVTCGTRV